MELRSTFQSIISLHQEELPFALQERSTQLPLDGNRIVTVTGIRRCGKSSLLGLTINRLLQQGIPNRLNKRSVASFSGQDISWSSDVPQPPQK